MQVFQNDANLTQKINVNKPMAFLVHGWMDQFFSSNLYYNGRGWPVATVQGLNGLGHFGSHCMLLTYKVSECMCNIA